MDPEVRIGVNVNVDVAAERQSTKNRLVVAFARTYLAEGNAGYLYPVCSKGVLQRCTLAIFTIRFQAIWRRAARES